MTLKRSHAIGVLLLGLFGLLFLDLLFSAPIDPFQAPPPLAFGSGAQTSGGFCATTLE